MRLRCYNSSGINVGTLWYNSCCCCVTAQGSIIYTIIGQVSVNIGNSGRSTEWSTVVICTGRHFQTGVPARHRPRLAVLLQFNWISSTFPRFSDSIRQPLRRFVRDFIRPYNVSVKIFSWKTTYREADKICTTILFWYWYCKFKPRLPIN